MALAEEKMWNDQLLPAAFMRASKSRARFRCSRKFSSMMKNDFTLREASASSISWNNYSPVEYRLTIFPLPPKNAEVVQKLQPMGHPTEAMMVAEVSRLSGIFTPMTRRSKPDESAGWRMGEIGRASCRERG